MSGQKRSINDYFSTSKKSKKQKIENDEDDSKLSESDNAGASSTFVSATDTHEPQEKLNIDIESDIDVEEAAAVSDYEDNEFFISDDKSEGTENFDEWLQKASTSTGISPTSSHLPRPPGPNDISQSPSDNPIQPSLQIFPKSKFGNRLRSFQKHWYNQFKWLEYSILTDGTYCFPCRHFSSHIAVAEETTFINIPFRNWKNALDSDSGFKKHDLSSEHKNCSMKWVTFSRSKTTGQSVMSKISEAHQRLVQENRKYLSIIADALLFTALQNIAQRGDDESPQSMNQGNFLQLIKLLSNHNEFFKRKVAESPENAKYTSPSIQNELLFTFSKLILKEISQEINQAMYFCVMCDETKDVSKTEQISVVLRYYLNGAVHERFLGYRAAKSLNASSLFNHMKELFSICQVDMNKCIAQTYDGANVMSGRLNGVQKLLREEVNQAIYVHCFNHRLNLVVTDVCKGFKSGQEFFNILENLYVFVSGSSVHLKFIEVQKQLHSSRKPLFLKKICYTRWSAQVFACTTTKVLLSELILLLNILSTEGNTTAVGLLEQLDFQFIFNLCFYCKILQMFKRVSDYLQSVTSNITQAIVLINSIETTFSTMRTDASFQEFNEIYKEAEKLAEENNVSLPEKGETIAKRSKKIPKKFESFFITEQSHYLEEQPIRSQDQFRNRVYYTAIDIILQELRNRFGEFSPVLEAMDALHPESDSFLENKKLVALALHYNINVDNLNAELKVLVNTIKQYEEKKRVKIRTIMEFLDLLEEYQIVFSETYKLAVISVTIPVSSAACERTFSCLRRIKTYLRNKMTDERLTHLAIINIERSVAKSLDLERVIDEFDSMHNNRRLILH